MDNVTKAPRCVVCQDEKMVDNGMGELGEAMPCEMCQFVNGLPRPAVVRFADDMEQRLLENDHRGGWHGESKQAMANQLAKATGDLLLSLAECEPVQLITSRAADVANIAMMIADNEQLGLWPKFGQVIQDMDTGKFLKLDKEAEGLEFPFMYVDRADQSEKYTTLEHACHVAFWLGEIGRRYRVIDFDKGGIQFIHAGGGNWVLEGHAEPQAVPASRPPVGD